MKNAIVIDRDYGSVSHQELNDLADKLALDGITLTQVHCQTEAQIIAAASDSAVLIATGNPPITRQVLASLPKLQAVIRMGIGVNSVDLEAATELGKAVLFMPGFCIRELADHATALMLGLNRNAAYYDRHIRAGQWPKAGYYMPRSLKNMTLGLYGFGGSARELYKICHDGFGMKVITCDPYAKKGTENVTFVDFETLLAQSDVLSIHAPLNKETYHIFSKDVFRKMKSDATIINVSRGGLIDQEALADALEEGQLRFAGLDVFEQEPLPVSSRLLSREDVMLTCHSAFYGEEAKGRQLLWAYELTSKALNGQPLPKGKLANPGAADKTNYIWEE